jgi:hypothetical protein
MFVLNVFVLNAVFVTDREEIWLQTGTITFMRAAKAVAGGLKSPRDLPNSRIGFVRPRRLVPKAGWIRPAETFLPGRI